MNGLFRFLCSYLLLTFFIVLTLLGGNPQAHGAQRQDLNKSISVFRLSIGEATAFVSRSGKLVAFLSTTDVVLFNVVQNRIIGKWVLPVDAFNSFREFTNLVWIDENNIMLEEDNIDRYGHNYKDKYWLLNISANRIIRAKGNAARRYINASKFEGGAVLVNDDKGNLVILKNNVEMGKVPVSTVRGRNEDGSYDFEPYYLGHNRFEKRYYCRTLMFDVETKSLTEKNNEEQGCKGVDDGNFNSVRSHQGYSRGEGTDFEPKSAVFAERNVVYIADKSRYDNEYWAEKYGAYDPTDTNSAALNDIDVNNFTLVYKVADRKNGIIIYFFETDGDNAKAYRVFNSITGQKFDYCIFSVESDGGESEPQTTKPPFEECASGHSPFLFRLSPDGRYFTFVAATGNRGGTIFIHNTANSKAVFNLDATLGDGLSDNYIIYNGEYFAVKTFIGYYENATAKAFEYTCGVNIIKLGDDFRGTRLLKLGDEFSDLPHDCGQGFDIDSNGSIYLLFGDEIKVVSGRKRKTVYKMPNSVHGVSLDLIERGNKFVIGRNDGGFEVVTPANATKSYSVFFDKKHWLIVSSQGYFSTNMDNEAQLVGWYLTFDHKTYALSDLWDVFHRPDLINRIIAGEDVRSLTNNFNLSKAIANPAPKAEFKNEFLETKETTVKIPYAVHSTGGGISEIRVFHNGKLVQSDGFYKDAVGKTLTLVAARSPEASAHAKGLRSARGGWNDDEVAGTKLPPELIVRKALEKKCDPCKGVAEIEVLPGEENTVTVVAFNRDGTIQSAPATVRFQSTLPKEEPRLWIFPVGIDRYASFSKLQNAGKDARDFVCAYAGKEKSRQLGMVCEQSGAANGLFKPENVHVVTPLFDQGAGKAAILNGLAEVAAKAKPQDTFVWFVSGHGMMDANSVFGIIAHDTQCTARDGKGNCTDVRGHITSNEILEASKKIKAMKQLMVLDTCQSGGLDDRLSGLYDARMSGLARNMGLHMYAAAQSTEEAQDGVPGNNGVFTAQLLEGLRGKVPDADKDQRISIVELGHFARTRTVDQSRTSKYPQHPVVKHFGQDAPLLRADGVR